MIDIEATSPEEAARKALKIQRDSETIATCFDVVEYPDRFDSGDPVTRVDLGGDCPVDPNLLIGMED